MKKTAQRWLEKRGEQMGFDLPYFAKNGFWVALRQGVSATMGLLLTVAFARLVSQEILGQYQFVLAILSIVSVLSIPGLNTSIIRSASSGHDGDFKKVVKMSLLWSLLGIPTLFLVGSYYYVMGDHLLGTALFVSAILFPLFYAPNTWDSFLQGKGRFDVVARYGLVQTTINTLATIGVIFLYRDNLILLVTCYLLTFSLTNIYFFSKSIQYVENERQDGEVVQYGWFLTKINILGILADNIDKVLIGAMLSSSALAAYYVLSVVPLRAKDVLKPFFSILYPKLSMIDGNLWSEIRRRKMMVAILLAILLLAISIYIACIPTLNHLLFGERYALYYKYSAGYAVMLFVLPLILTVIKYAQVKKYERVIAFSDSGYAILRILLNIVLIFYFGLLGAIVAYNLSVLVWLLLYLLSIQRSEKSERLEQG